MLLPIVDELIHLVKDPAVSSSPSGPSAFMGPIYNGFSPPKLITDTDVVRRIGYDQVPQNVAKPEFVPYLYWVGPMSYDKGQAAKGSAATKKADFYFYCVHSSMTKALRWVDDIEAAIDLLIFPYVLDTVRLTAAILSQKMPIEEDQTIKTANQFASNRAVIGYTFGYHKA